MQSSVAFDVYIVPAVCVGETVDVETATRGTEVGPIRGTLITKIKTLIINITINKY